MIGTSNRVVLMASAAGAMVGLAASFMLGAAHLAGGDYHVTQSSDGKAVYVWSIGGDGTINFVSSARTKHEAADDEKGKPDDKEKGKKGEDDEKKGKAPTDPGEKGKGKDKN